MKGLQPIRFMPEAVAKVVMPAIREAEAKKARFIQLKKERAEIVGFFDLISGDPHVKKSALRRQLRANTAAFETEFNIKEKV